ncbi:MFS general substrate transporter [Lactarius akahatsu]|uniref:MFS general substrate transporter n=1 Tax=Lactarius akahatsu TaxID=416441 RepID=A0AAD4QB05_9AGAM|nr:MFS general substrate transporter [Lactarius akahatsu]
MTSTSPSPPRSPLSLRTGPSQHPYSSANTIPPEGQLGDEAAELLHEFVYSHSHASIEGLPNLNMYDGGGVDIDKVALEAQRGEHAARPWWRRASATWFVVLCPLTAVAMSALIAPRLQLFTDLVCKELDDRQWDPAGTGAGRDVGFVGTSRPVPCAADPVVQMNVTKLLTITATVQGVLSCLTAAFWGSFSDRYGRVRFLAFNVTARLLADAALVALAVAPEKVPGSYWILVYISALEGLIGGPSAAIAAFHAYIADCSDPATRSRIFSRLLGVLFTGVALGPSLGGLIEHLSGKLYVVFYIALGLHVITACFFWLIIPESLLPAQMDFARRAHRASNQGRFPSWVFGFFAPLTVFAPVARKDGVTPQKSLKKDWSLTWLALSYAPDSLVFGGVQYWFQYAAGRFNWTGEMARLRLFASNLLAAICRALYLTLGLPALLRFFASRRPPVQLPTQPGEPLNARAESPSLSARASSRSPMHTHTPALDLGIAKASLVLHAISFALIAVSKNAGMFVAASMLATLSIGYAPVVQSLSLELYTRRGGQTSEAGRLFGAMSVIQALGNQILGPSLFGIVYMKTVATFPEAMFYVFMVVVLLSLSFLFLVQIPPESNGKTEDGGVEVEVEAPAAATAIISAPVIVVDDGEASVRGRQLSRTPIS